MVEVKVWDPVVRICHWFTVAVVLVNTTILDEGSIHEALGYSVVVLLAVRLVWGGVGSKYARFSTFFPTRKRLRKHLAGLFLVDKSLAGKSGDDRATLGHNPLGALMIFNLLLTLAVVCLTGHFMTTDRFWGSEIMEDVHEAFVVYLLVSVAAHVAGILVESFRTRVNLISAMVTGKKKLSSTQLNSTQLRKLMPTNEKYGRLLGGAMSRDFLTLWVGLALSTICTAFFAMDVAGDLLFDNDFPGGKLHLGLEIFVVIISVSAFSFHILELSRLVRKHEKINNQVRIASGEFAGVIEELFVSWQLTPAERDVAMLLVKGLSFGGIAEARNAKEGTVKAQSNAIYRKASVSGRHELVSLFLDELLQGIEIGPTE